MPSEAKFSPEFHEVRPDTVPPHSFCQTLRPMRIASARERSIACATVAEIRIASITTAATHLDGRGFAASMHALLNTSGTVRPSLNLMKHIRIVLAGILLAAPAFAQQSAPLKDDKEKVSYSIGLDIGSTFKKQYMDIDTDVLMRGLKDGLSGAKPAMSEEEIKATMTAYSKTMMEKAAQRNKESAGANLEKGQKFLEEN